MAAAGHTDVELDLATGRRARRGRDALDALAAAVPDAGAVHVVNNGAAALVLAATALAAGREIVVSRGELVEIGDGFRLPDLLVSTGARLREVGTTNRTTLRRLRRRDRPADRLRAQGAPVELRGHRLHLGRAGAAAGHASACRWSPTSAPGCSAPTRCCPTSRTPPAPCAPARDLVTASGDKLLGGPQAGLLLGDADLVDRLRRHPLARALRVDKLTLAALAATLRRPDTPDPRGPARRPGGPARRGRAAARRGSARTAPRPRWCPAAAVVGGGGAPGVELDSWALSLPERYAAPLRAGDPPVLGRVVRGRLLLDLRCVPRRRRRRACRAAVLRVPAGRPDV